MWSRTGTAACQRACDARARETRLATNALCRFAVDLRYCSNIFPEPTDYISQKTQLHLAIVRSLILMEGVIQVLEVVLRNLGLFYEAIGLTAKKMYLLEPPLETPPKP